MAQNLRFAPHFLLPVPNDLPKEKFSFAIITENSYKIMGVTRLKRKEKRNRAVANNRVARIKQLLKKPEVVNVDVEAIKAEFAAKAK